MSAKENVKRIVKAMRTIANKPISCNVNFHLKNLGLTAKRTISVNRMVTPCYIIEKGVRKSQ